jgi:hypothetical protein
MYILKVKGKDLYFKKSSSRCDRAGLTDVLRKAKVWVTKTGPALVLSEMNHKTGGGYPFMKEHSVTYLDFEIVPIDVQIIN